MDDIIRNMTGEQALKVIQQLCRKEGKIRDAVITAAMKVVTKIVLDDLAAEVATVLELIDVQDCWDRAGGSRDGYTSPDEAAGEIIQEELQPFFDQANRFHAMELPEQEASYCMGVLAGIYRFDQECESEFRQWASDIPGEFGSDLLEKWQKRNPDKARINAMHAFIRAQCPKWADWLKPTKP